MGFGYLVQATQARAIGASSIDEGEKIYLTGSSHTGEKPQSTVLFENSKDKVLLEAPMLFAPTLQHTTMCSHSDFLTFSYTRIYKSQNDP